MIVRSIYQAEVSIQLGAIAKTLISNLTSETAGGCIRAIKSPLEAD
ncbi:MAG: hypothetical protein QXT53_02425 [Ignisphaera sp.]